MLNFSACEVHMDQQYSRLACDEDFALLSTQPDDQLWTSLSGMRASR